MLDRGPNRLTFCRSMDELDWYGNRLDRVTMYEMPDYQCGLRIMPCTFRSVQASA